MTPQSVPEIQEAIELFRKYETSTFNQAAINNFVRAVDILDDYISDEPTTPHKQYIRNLRFANTRRMLQNLSKVNKKHFGTWGEHVLAILVKVQREATEVMQENPELEAEFDIFLNVWKKELAQALVEDLDRQQNKNSPI